MSAPLVVTVAIAGGTARYVSTQGYVSAAADTPASTAFLPRIRGAIRYDRSVGCSVWGNSHSVAAVGSIDLDNTDGALDSWLAEEWRDRIVTIKRGLATSAYSALDLIAYAVVDRVSMPDLYTLRIGLRDKGALLDVALQTAVYGVIASVPTLEGTHKPILIGECEGVPLTLVHGTNLDYDVNDEALFALDEVTDQGVILTEGAQWEDGAGSVYGVRRLTNPAGKQVCKARGCAKAGPTLIEQLPDVLDELLSRSPVSTSDQHATSADDLDTATSYKLCYFGRDGTTISNVLTQVMDSFTGWWFFDRLGLLKVGRLLDPGTYDPLDPEYAGLIQLDDITIVGGIRIRLDEARGLSDSVAAERNWSPHKEGEIAGYVHATAPDRAARIAGEYQVRKGVNTLHGTYAQAVDAPPIKTLLSDEADGQTEADRITDLYSTERYFYDLTAALEGSDAYELEPGNVVVLTSDRYGLSAGKALVVVSVRTNLMSSLVQLTLWGEGPQSGDF